MPENYPLHIALPRGCLDAAQELLPEHGIRCNLKDERFAGKPLDVQSDSTTKKRTNKLGGRCQNSG